MSTLFFLKKETGINLPPPAFVVFVAQCTEKYHSRKFGKATLIYFISAECFAFFLLHAFLEAMFLLQLVVWSIFRRKIIGVKIFCFMDHEMCDFIISLVTTKKSLKKLKTFMCLERTS